jgi:hypothetical protein
MWPVASAGASAIVLDIGLPGGSKLRCMSMATSAWRIAGVLFAVSRISQIGGRPLLPPQIRYILGRTL